MTSSREILCSVFGVLFSMPFPLISGSLIVSFQYTQDSWERIEQKKVQKKTQGSKTKSPIINKFSSITNLFDFNF